MPPECVVLPGWSMEAASLAPLARSLEPRARCLDLPGQGERGDETMPDSLDDLARMLECDIEAGAVLIGWSLGALAAFEIAARGRVRLSALVLITPTPRFLSAPDWEYGIDAELLDRYDRESRKDATALRDEFAALLLVGDARRQTAARQLRELRRNAPAPRPDALAAGLSILRLADRRDACGSVATPTLVIAGGGDRVTPPGAARWMTAALPRATHVEFAAAGHALPISHVAEITDTIAGFLSRRAASRRAEPA